MSVPVITLLLGTICQLEIWSNVLVGAEINMHYSLCGPENEIDLVFDETTTATINLLPNHMQRGQCKLKVTAPPTHLINMQWSEGTEELHRAFIENVSAPHPCPLNVFLSENKRTPVWKGDPCTVETLPDFDILTAPVKIVWMPPKWGNHTWGRKLILTAVGQGDMCKQPDQHTCMRIGWDPMMCVSRSLICDGIVHCPKSASTSDEDEYLCQTSHGSKQAPLHKFALQIFKKIQSEKGFWGEKWQPEVQDTDSTTESVTMKTAKDHANTDSVSAALSHYGPWGYLMLGMLICGTVLMFCGLWECCFRRPKPSNEGLATRQQPTTVLILNPPQNETSSQQPPNYDDLDQPPSYSVLFPNRKLQCVSEETVVNISDDHSGQSDSHEESYQTVAEGHRQVEEAGVLRRSESQNRDGTSSEFVQ